MRAPTSLPSRERGLKSKANEPLGDCRRVAPFTGAWIEIRNPSEVQGNPPVAPFTGAWIEIVSSLTAFAYRPSRSLHGSVD